MNIYFTRHARQRLKLYRIDRKEVESILTGAHADQEPVDEAREFVSDAFVRSIGFPLKIAYVRENARVVVKTLYPLDRKTKYEDIVR
jgi:hypothetical protein